MKQTLLFLLLLFVFSCSNDDDILELDEGIIFGEVYGLCSGDCRNLFLLTENNLYEDLNKETDYGNWENTSFKKQPLTNEKYELAKILLSIPNGLFELENTFEDQQIYSDIDYYIHIKRGNEIQTLIFDKPHEKADNESKLYLEKLMEVYNKLTLE